jgi:glycosyltransferase involved in cell wall biosynthesis
MTMVSAIIPVYNGGSRVREAVDSVLSQTYRNLEVLVVADGGADDLAWVDGLDPRLRVHRQANAGVSAARNNGLKLTSGPLVAYLDQDDRWLPTKVERQVATLPDAAVWSTADFWWCLPGGERKESKHDVLTRNGLLSGSHFCLSTLLVRRVALEQVGGFDPSLAMLQDWELALRLGDAGPAAHCPETLVDYVVHDANGSRDHRRGYAERARVLREAPRTDSERAAAAQGRRESRVLYGEQAWSAFARDRRPGDAGRALAWAPKSVARGLVAAARNRLS